MVLDIIWMTKKKTTFLEICLGYYNLKHDQAYYNFTWSLTNPTVVFIAILLTK